MEGQIRHGKHDLFGRRGFGPLEGKLPSFGFGLVLLKLLFELLRLLLTGTGLARLGGLGLEAPHEVHLVRDLVGYLLCLPFALLIDFRLKLQELGVAALAEYGLRRAEIQNMGAHMVHEHAVMRHKDENPLEFQKEFFQPFHGLKVQMVGGFVEEKHVRARGEHARKLGALSPSAGKLTDGQLPLLLRKSETGKHRLRALLGIVAVARLKIVLTRHEAVHGRLVAPALRLLPFLPEIAPVGERILHPLQKRHVQRLFIQYLFHIAHAAAVRNDDAASVRRDHPGHHAQQGGFARAVGTAHAKAHAVHDVQRKIMENIASAV